MKKRNVLFMILGIIILAYCVLTWILPTVSSFGGDLSSATRNQMGLFQLAAVPFEAFGGFANLLVFILLVGGFYGVLEISGVYKRMLNLFADKFKGKEKIFLIALICLVAIISSITGLEVGLFFMFPLLISILLVMGYDKLTALSATLGATIVGMFGATFAGTLYSVGNQSFNLTMTSGILAKVILLVLGTGLLIFFTLMHVNKLTKKDKELVKEDVKEILVDVKEDKEKAKKKIWPLVLIVDLVLLFLVLGTTDWEGIFGFNWFSTAYDWLMKVEIGGFAIFGKLFAGITAFGTWFAPNRFGFYSMFMLVALVVIAIVYGIKPSDLLDGFINGVKKYIVPALLAVLASSIFVFVLYFPVYNTIGTWIMQLSDKFNVALTGVFSLLSGAFYVDFYYYSYYVLSYVGQVAGDANLYSLVNIMFTSLYSLAMLIAPTSVLLLISLAITNVSYKEWIKHIWKLFLSLLIVAFIVFSILLLI